MNDKDKKVVNTEEQNRTVNPADRDYKEGDQSQEPLMNTNTNTENPPETEKPDGGSEVERPHRIEGEDAGDIERKIPNM
jgi:hypothetical protein